MTDIHSSFSQCEGIKQVFCKKSFYPGTLDFSGKFMGGTELISMVAHKGKLYAGNGYWMETDENTIRGGQILALDSPNDKWRLDMEILSTYERIVTLKSVTFTKNSLGKPIKPESLLLAATESIVVGPVTQEIKDINQDPSKAKGNYGKVLIAASYTKAVDTILLRAKALPDFVTVYSRDDDINSWVPMHLFPSKTWNSTRKIELYRDAVTELEYVFVGNSETGLFRGAYSADEPGHILWNKSPEFIVPQNERVLGITECNGILYCATTRHIFARQDGPNPAWRPVYEFLKTHAGSGIRGLTAVPNPRSDDTKVLLFSVANKVRHIDPYKDYEETIEFDQAECLSKVTGLQVGGMIAAYNDFTPVRNRQAGETDWLFGFEASYTPEAINNYHGPELNLVSGRSSQPGFTWHWAGEGRFFTRHSRNGNLSYSVSEVVDPDVTPKPKLLAVRTIIISPFPEDNGQILYFGGYDTNYIPAHNTAWIYRSLPGQF